MKKILVLLPENIKGRLITEGFADGFEQNKCRVLKKNIDKISFEEVKKFYPDMIFSYDYCALQNKNCSDIIEKCGCKNLVCYFADEPKKIKIKNFNTKIFVWDEEFINKFENAKYLPLAVSPKQYKAAFAGFKYSITFVGEPLGEKRQKILSELVKIYKNKVNIFCNDKGFQKSIEEIKEKNLLNEGELEIYSKCHRGFLENTKQLASVYNSSKINLNITRQGKNSINYRVFEVLASCGFLLTDEREDLQNYFKVSKHLETYKNLSDLTDKIDFFLENLNIAQRIAQLGRFEAIESNTYSARAKIILK